jgi:uncharacterized protein
MILLDVNILLALADLQHPHHAIAKTYFVNRSPGIWATCPLVENGFLRILLGNAYAQRVENPQTARAILDQMILSSAGHQFWLDDLSLRDESHFPTLPHSKHLTDCYLLAMAVKRGGQFVTFDRRIDPSWVPGGSQALLVLETRNP